ncbi:hypothetical protein CFC21_028049 [Triticum aestivum]|uniref:Pectinesterase inhibitor domain-containing protein n=3 Tax=Triticinae TaxID=1648030 RepID=A0A9R1JEH5_WHEAT|nr:hypothetical protein CFC21_028047 [Triticum aestivum]KAF7014019.1 hypothetical protein CFC21_028049 [Triticum aestivum]
MKSMATTIYVLALSLTTTTLLFTGSSACPRDPLMTIAAACHQVSTGQPLLELCMKTLHAAFENSEVTEYANIAAGTAQYSCQETQRIGKNLLQNPSLPKELRAAYDHCIGKYDMVKNKIGAIDNAVRTCWFATFKQDCVDVAAAIDDCAHNLQPVGSSSPLYKMVLTDRDLSTLSCSLALHGVAKQWH